MFESLCRSHEKEVDWDIEKWRHNLYAGRHHQRDISAAFLSGHDNSNLLVLEVSIRIGKENTQGINSKDTAYNGNSPWNDDIHSALPEDCTRPTPALLISLKFANHFVLVFVQSSLVESGNGREWA